MLEWTLPSDSRPRKCSALPEYGSWQSASFQVSDAYSVPVLDGLADQLCALGVDLAAAQRVVADLGVAHIVVRGQTDGGAVGFQLSMGAGGKQMIQRGSLGNRDRVAAAAVALADAVHDNKNNGFFHNKSLQKKSYSYKFAFYWILLFYIIFAELTTTFLIFP